jgi:uncharacterized Zn finger protein
MPTEAIRVDCPACGPIEVAPRDARLELVLDRADAVGSLQFRCTGCGHGSSQQLTEQGTRLIMAAGITLVSSPIGIDTAIDGSGTERSS